MRILDFLINGQTIIRDPTCDFKGLASGSRGYLKCRFEFSPEWAGYAKVARFERYDDVIFVPLVDNACMVPDCIADKVEFSVSVIAESESEDIRITTNRLTITQAKGGA